VQSKNRHNRINRKIEKSNQSKSPESPVAWGFGIFFIQKNRRSFFIFRNRPTLTAESRFVHQTKFLCHVHCPFTSHGGCGALRRRNWLPQAAQVPDSQPVPDTASTETVHQTKVLSHVCLRHQ
jgi:hypothetical protein